MGIFNDIKTFINDITNDYKSYKNPNALIRKNTSTGRNVFKYINLLFFGRKYGEKLFNLFGVKNDLIDYEFLINIFGEKNLKKALDSSELTAAQIADMLLTPEKSDAFYSAQKDQYVVTIISQHILFNKVTGLNLSSFQKGLSPQYFSRDCYGFYKDGKYISKTLLDIWKDNNVSKDNLKEIYDIYGDEIVSQYNADMKLRNDTILVTDKYNQVGAVGGLQDHVTYYSEDDFKCIFDKYFNGEELKENEKYILIGLLAKTTDLISLYSIKYLKEQPDYIKSEIRLGIFQDMVVANKEYTNEDRKRLVSLDGLWNSDDLARYNNLLLLKKRLPLLYKGEELEEKITYIDDILSKPFEEVAKQADNIAESMNSLYMQYEIDNRQNIVERVYNPENQETVIIDDLSKIDSAAMLHFFDPSRKISNFNSYIKDLEEKRSKELGKKFVFSEEEKKKMELQYLAKENHFITDYALDFEGIGQIGTFDARYVTNTSNQLCALIATPKSILEGRGLRGRIALRFF